MAIYQTHLKNQPYIDASDTPSIKLKGSNWLERSLQRVFMPLIQSRYGGPVHPQKGELELRYGDKALFVGDSPNHPSKSALVGNLLGTFSNSQQQELFERVQYGHYHATQALRNQLDKTIDSPITDDPVLEHYANHTRDYLLTPGQNPLGKTKPLTMKQMRRNKRELSEWDTRFIKAAIARYPKHVRQFLEHLDIKKVVGDETLITMAEKAAEEKLQQQHSLPKPTRSSTKK